MTPTADQMRLALDLKEALLAAYDPEAIILFGSLGRGDADEFSDVDLLLIIETDRDLSDLSKEMAEYLDPLAKDKHIIVRTPQDFCRQRDIPGTIPFSVARDGQILFDKKGWRRRYLPLDSYETRKQEIIQQEYVQSAQDFLNQAELALQGNNLFRCRDFARFAVLRAIKGVFVEHDMDPPRETDLVELLSRAAEVESDLSQYIGFVRELNGYYPCEGDNSEKRRSSRMLERTVRSVRGIIGTYAPI